MRASRLARRGQLLEAFGECLKFPLSCQGRGTRPIRLVVRDFAERRIGHHCGKAFVESQIAFRIGKATTGDYGFKVRVSLQQAGRCLLTYASRAGDFVGRVTAQRDEVGHLVQLHTVAVPYFGRTDPSHLALARVENGSARRCKLEGVSVPASDDGMAPSFFLLGNSRREEVIGFEPGRLANHESECLDQFWKVGQLL